MASSSGRQPNFAALNRGRHVYSAGRPSRWALAHISGFFCSFLIVLRSSQVSVSFVRPLQVYYTEHSISWRQICDSWVLFLINIRVHIAQTLIYISAQIVMYIYNFTWHKYMCLIRNIFKVVQLSRQRSDDDRPLLDRFDWASRFLFLVPSKRRLFKLLRGRLWSPPPCQISPHGCNDKVQDPKTTIFTEIWSKCGKQNAS